MKATIKFCLFLLSIFIFSCEKNPIDETISNPSPTSNIKTIGFESLKQKIPQAINTIQRLEGRKSNGQLFRLQDEYKFNLDSIKEYYESANYQSYTINTEKANPLENEYIYKLLIESRNDTIKSSILTFDFKENKLVPIKQEPFVIENGENRTECYMIIITTDCTCHTHSAPCEHPSVVGNYLNRKTIQ
jgi:hypothetical protein